MIDRLERSFKDLNELRETLQSYDKDTLIDTLAYLLKIYILDAQKSGVPSSRHTGSINFESFYECIDMLKAQNKFPEMQLFSLLEGKVFVNVQGKNCELHVSSESSPKKETSPPEGEQNSDCESETLTRFSNLEI